MTTCRTLHRDDVIHLSQKKVTDAEYAEFFNHSDHNYRVHASQFAAALPSQSYAAPPTCEPAGLGQQEGAPRHEEEEGRLQQWETVQLGELGDVGVELKTQH